MLSKILVAYDGSKAAERAFRLALEIAKPFKSAVTVLAVARPPEPPTIVETQALLDNATEQYEQDFIGLRKEAETMGVELNTVVAAGHPADQIVHYAAEEKVDLIVMGHRGKSLVQRWLLGSVSKRVMSYASCSVLVVR